MAEEEKREGQRRIGRKGNYVRNHGGVYAITLESRSYRLRRAGREYLFIVETWANHLRFSKQVWYYPIWENYPALGRSANTLVRRIDYEPTLGFGLPRKAPWPRRISSRDRRY
jgi:hypothetical protein